MISSKFLSLSLFVMAGVGLGYVSPVAAIIAILLALAVFVALVRQRRRRAG